MTLVPHAGDDGQIWQCRKTVDGVRHNSIFQNSNLPLRDILFALYEWSSSSPVASTAYELSLSEHTVVSWFQTFRSIASSFAAGRLPAQIGGPGDIVEIDKCQIGRRKHHRGRHSNEVWLFGAMVRGAHPPRIFVQAVARRDQRTL
jgi:hypothetical protein